ncbi:MAG: hypothetical protein E7576_16200 [Ruminococcaceae bacterium]|jgi:uncharacterized integral membrane protein|nr:hypothetical protein [Oscillospiraceae bacterium]
MNKETLRQKKRRAKKNSRVLPVILYLIAVLILIGIVYYVTLPPLNIHAGGFWTFVIFLGIVVTASYFIIGTITGKMFVETVRFPSGNIDFQTSMNGMKTTFPKIMGFLGLAVIAFLIVGSIAGSQMFRAKTYSSLITVEEEDFASGIAETEYVTDIALMDTASARIIGARTLGTLSDLVSQYQVSYNYTQIAMQNADGESHPYKVAPLEYESFFKWVKNRQAGIPGYVKVDTVKFEADFVRLTGDYIRYSPSAYFSKNLTRALRFAYPTAIFGSVCFEVDDAGHPYWVASTMKPHAGLFGAMDVDKVVTLDAVTGETAIYAPADSPDWIDIVYYGDLICRKYDWYGMLRGGYLNSAFSQVNCVVTTDDFGYKIIGNDVYIFTGVTSTASDEANVGFILANSRTGDYKFFSVAGAEEYSAMSAAEGSVQQYGYRASFPSLINVGGEATYIMVLKDASGIVKMYSMVNVKNYNIVVTSTTQDEVFRLYKAALAQNGTRIEAVAGESQETVLNEIVYVVQGGETVVYLKTEAGIFKTAFTEDLLFLEEGDRISMEVGATDDSGVRQAYSVKKGR